MSQQHENGLMILLARAMARDSGVEVLTGAEAKTDGKRIWMPPLPPEDEKSFALGMRWVLHETGHVNHSDFKVIQEAAKEGGLLPNMLNTLEDIRIEAEKSRELPGAGRRFSEGIMALKETGKIGIREEDSPAAVMSKFMLYKLRADLLGQPLAEEGKVAQGALKSLIGETKALKAEIIGRQVMTCKNTAQVLELSRKVVTMLEEEDPEENQDQNQDRQSDSDGGGSPDPQAARENIEQMLQGMSEDEEAASNLEEIAKQALGEASEKAGDEGHRMTGGAMPGSNQFKKPVKNDGAWLMQRVKTSSAAMRETFESVVQAKTLAGRHHVQRGTRIDPKRLARVKAGERRIFIQRVEAEKIDTAVHLAIDLSGSMSGGPEQVAKEAAMAMVMALDGFQGVEVSVSAFGRYLTPLKEWEEDIMTAASHLSGTRDGGGTAMEEAVMDGADRLMANRRPRKLMFVVTDGQAYDTEGLARTVDSLRSMGIDTFGIGVQSDASDVFGTDYSVLINDINELAGTLFGLLQNNMFTEALAA